MPRSTMIWLAHHQAVRVLDLDGAPQQAGLPVQALHPESRRRLRVAAPVQQAGGEGVEVLAPGGRYSVRGHVHQLHRVDCSVATVQMLAVLLMLHDHRTEQRHTANALLCKLHTALQGSRGKRHLVRGDCERLSIDGQDRLPVQPHAVHGKAQGGVIHPPGGLLRLHYRSGARPALPLLQRRAPLQQLVRRCCLVFQPLLVDDQLVYVGRVPLP